MKFTLDWQCDPFGWHDVRTGSVTLDAEDMVEACVLAKRQVAEELSVHKTFIHITRGTIHG